MGIAMCHFELTARELGLTGDWVIDEPDIKKPDESTEYTVSWRRAVIFACSNLIPPLRACVSEPGGRKGKGAMLLPEFAIFQNFAAMQHSNGNQGEEAFSKGATWPSIEVLDRLADRELAPRRSGIHASLSKCHRPTS